MNNFKKWLFFGLKHTILGAKLQV